ncbi:unnamed protein product [Effrenium voratum]|nr:unnamed protein product [Effrenium voratum]
MVVELQKGVTHSEPVVEGPLAGKDFQVRHLLPRLGCKLPATGFPRLLPQGVLSLAKRVMPF